MALPRFDYHAPDTLDEAVALLAGAARPYGADRARILAGGQTLLPLLACGAVRAGALIDIGRLDELRHLERADGRIRIGALVSHATLERDGPLRVVRQAAARIGNAAVRTRGTIGGSLAVATPGAEWCVTANAFDGEVLLSGPAGERTVPVGDFLLGPAGSPVGADEILTGVQLREPTLAGLAGHRDRQSGLPLLAVAATVGATLRLALGGGAPPVPTVVSVDRDAPTGPATTAEREALIDLLAATVPTGGDRDLAVGLGRRAIVALEEQTP